MPRQNRDLTTVLVDIIGMYIATHPHALDDAKRRFWYYSATAMEHVTKASAAAWAQCEANYRKTNA
jgi:hypothetical protein